MNQQSLFHEDVYEALQTDVQACGGNKVVGSLLYAEMPPDKAGEKLARCLNQHHQQELKPDQVSLIIKQASKGNSFATIYFICQEANLSQPERIEPEDEKAKLQREFIQMGESMKKMLEQIQRQETIKAVV